jgi:hypothetical protein
MTAAAVPKIFGTERARGSSLARGGDGWSVGTGSSQVADRGLAPSRTTTPMYGFRTGPVNPVTVPRPQPQLQAPAPAPDPTRAPGPALSPCLGPGPGPGPGLSGR